MHVRGLPRINLRGAGAQSVALASGGGGSPYVANAVHFDGATAFYRSSPLIGVSDSPVGIFSYWFNINSDHVGAPWAQTSGLLGSGLPDDNQLSQSGPNGIFSTDPPEVMFLPIYLTDAAYANDVQFDPSPMPLKTDILGSWHNLLYSWNTQTQLFQVALDGVLQTTNIAFQDGGPFDVNCSALATTIGAEGWNPDGSILMPFSGDLSQIYINFSASIDLSVQANIDKFILAGKPANPSGFPAGACMLFDGDATTFPVNQGSGGAFVLGQGTLTNATTSPSD